MLRRFRWAAILTAIILLECIVLAANGGRCPLTAKDLADYQRLTSEGKLAEAGQKLEQLKQKLDRLNVWERQCMRPML